MNPKRISQGFTLIELLIVVAIIALLIAITLPSLSRAQELTRRTVCQGNIRAIATGLVSYAQDNDGAVPLACWQSGARALRRMNYAISYIRPENSPDPDKCPMPDGQLGLLIQPGNEYVDNAERFYSPSAKDAMWMYNNPDPEGFSSLAQFQQAHSTDNLWWDHAYRGSRGLVRLGYGVRPMTGWFNYGWAPWRERRRPPERDDPPLTAEELHNSNGNLPRLSTPTPLHYNGRRMMVSLRSTDAMVADITNNPGRVD